MKYKTVIIILFSILTFSLKAAKLDISIFHNICKKQLSFTSKTGKYVIIANQKTVLEIQKGEALRISQVQDSLISLYHGNKFIGNYKELYFKGKGFVNVFTLKIGQSPINIRDYDDDLIIRFYKHKIQLINRVDIENYTAGVVESEALGSSKDLQFFFVQAITCRTYALVNYLKHADEGFNLCDDVHCQYYLGRCHHSDILRATARTSGEVIVDENQRMISAAFHSNCGGQTANSEDVWSVETPYLKSVKDTFCTHSSNANWEYAMKTDEWLAFLNKQYDYPVSDSKMRRLACTYEQKERKKYFENGIELKHIRRDLKLRSTFFSIEQKGDSVLFHGRGYGHGVGLCQQGAIRMANLGVDYKDIIHFYYHNTSIIHYTELHYDFMP